MGVNKGLNNIDRTHFDLTNDIETVENMDISPYYSILTEKNHDMKRSLTVSPSDDWNKRGAITSRRYGATTLRAGCHPLYHGKNNIHAFGKILQSEWTKYCWHSLMETIQCASTIDCGQGKIIPHHSALIQWDHIDSAAKVARIMKEVETNGGTFARTSIKVSVGHLLSQSRNLNVYRRTGREASKYKCTLWHEDVNNYTALYYELLLCRPLCPNCHALQTAYENRTRASKEGFVLGWMEKDECNSLVEKQNEHLTTSSYYSGEAVTNQVETDPKLLKLARTKVLDAFKNYYSLDNGAEFNYIKSHPDYLNGTMNQRNFSHYIAEYRKSNDLFLKN